MEESAIFGASQESPRSQANTGSPKQHRASIGKKFTYRPATDAPTASLGSIDSLGEAETPQNKKQRISHHANQPHHITSRVKQWLDAEKARKLARRQSRSHKKHAEDTSGNPSDTRRDSSDSDEAALNRLEQIIANTKLDEKNLLVPGGSRRPSYSSRKISAKHLLRRKSTAASSDTDYTDGDILVPSAEVVLDNTKTLKYSNSDDVGSTPDLQRQTKRREKEKEAWLSFKNEIVRLSHTLKLKGWRRVPLDHGGEITVERLSGAMTNAVYVVSPPAQLPDRNLGTQKGDHPKTPRRSPM